MISECLDCLTVTADLWTSSFQTPGWNKEPLRCCFMKGIIFLLAEMMKKMRKTTRSFIFLGLQTCGRIFALGLCRWMTDERKSPPEVPAAAAAAARGRRHSACNSATFRLESQVSLEMEDRTVIIIPAVWGCRRERHITSAFSVFAKELFKIEIFIINWIIYCCGLLI